MILKQNVSKQSLSLVAVGIAAIWILALHGMIVFWAMSEPASIERRSDSVQKPPAHTKVAAKPETSVKPETGEGGQATASGGEDFHSTAGMLVKGPSLANPVLGWSHVAFPAVLLGSCVAILAILIWGAVALNREIV